MFLCLLYIQILEKKLGWVTEGGASEFSKN
jgi:hypothetical protein